MKELMKVNIWNERFGFISFFLNLVKNFIPVNLSILNLLNVPRGPNIFLKIHPSTSALPDLCLRINS